MDDPLNPQALSRNLIYRSHWVNLYVDKVLFPNGSIIEQHHLLDFDFPAVMAVANDQDNRFLMVKVCRYPTGRAEWEFPAGRIENGEEIIEAASQGNQRWVHLDFLLTSPALIEMRIHNMIECRTLFGLKKLVPKDELIIRPTAYAVILWDRKILLVNTHSTGKLYFPGGAVNSGEKIEAALRREVREETGIEIEVENFIHFKEDFFYNDPLDEAYHSFIFFYLCRPLTFGFLDDNEIEDGEAEKPTWYDLESLHENDFQSHSEVLEKVFQSQAKLVTHSLG